jgi:hypothetical protein
MNWRQIIFLLYPPLFQAKNVMQGYRRFSAFPVVKVVMMLCMSLVASAFLLVPMPVEAAGQHRSDEHPVNCTLIVPPHPLTAKGLATPYQLVGTDPHMPCHEANTAQTAFVQGAILDLDTGQISIYDPLVVDKGTQPAITPLLPKLPDNELVALWFGFNGTNLTLQGTNNSLKEGRCVNGSGNSLFGQFAYCNAGEFFAKAHEAIRRGKLTPPPLGKAADGLKCPSTRDFSVVDQDQSDNVTTSYLVLNNGQTAQDTLVNRDILTRRGQQFKVLTNPSDNKLLVGFIDPALGCRPWTAPNLADPGQRTTALPLNELQAAIFQPQPVALIPAGDPMVLVNGQPNLKKLNLFRIGVDQPQVENLDQASTKKYCQNLRTTGAPRIIRDKPQTSKFMSPDPAVGNSLFTFLAQRFNGTWGPMGLNCVGRLGQPSPIIVTTDANGVAIDATLRK